ncbi:NECA1 protein, partial [Ptilorrhoa leucosticta]|nr:NECA1 protein [Ptilorrhoa leucosticta]
DDGKLSFEEFKNYFADGILSSEELWELFSGIDRHHSDNVDTEKLCGKSGDVPAPESFPSPACVWWGLCVSDLGRTGCHRQYETSSKMEQFLTRFLLRETMHQLQSLQASLECAVDTVEEQAGRERAGAEPGGTPCAWLAPGNRRAPRGSRGPQRCRVTRCAVPRGAWPPPAALGSSCRRGTSSAGISAAAAEHSCFPRSCPPSAALAPPLLPPTHLPTGWGQPQPFLWQEGMATPGSCQGRASLPSPGSGSLCPHSVSACKLTDEACFILYEFWQDVTSWRSHLQSSCSKTFQQSILSLLESPELLTTMLFPGEGGCLSPA